MRYNFECEETYVFSSHVQIIARITEAPLKSSPPRRPVNTLMILTPSIDFQAVRTGMYERMSVFYQYSFTHTQAIKKRAISSYKTFRLTVVAPGTSARSCRAIGNRLRNPPSCNAVDVTSFVLPAKVAPSRPGRVQ